MCIRDRYLQFKTVAHLQMTSMYDFASSSEQFVTSYFTFFVANSFVFKKIKTIYVNYREIDMMPENEQECVWLTEDCINIYSLNELTLFHNVIMVANRAFVA